MKELTSDEKREINGGFLLLLGFYLAVFCISYTIGKDVAQNK
jgi:hypothetical protein